MQTIRIVVMILAVALVFVVGLGALVADVAADPGSGGVAQQAAAAPDVDPAVAAYAWPAAGTVDAYVPATGAEALKAELGPFWRWDGLTGRWSETATSKPAAIVTLVTDDAGMVTDVVVVENTTPGLSDACLRAQMLMTYADATAAGGPCAGMWTVAGPGATE